VANNRRSRPSVTPPPAEDGADLYAVLGVNPAAGPEQIQQAYRARARTLHPDVNSAPDATARFAQLQRAYEILADPPRRRLYDEGGGEDRQAPPEPVVRREPTYAWESIGTRRRDDDPGRASRASGTGDAGDPTGFEELYQAFFAPRLRTAKPDPSPSQSGPSA